MSCVDKIAVLVVVVDASVVIVVKIVVVRRRLVVGSFSFFVRPSSRPRSSLSSSVRSSVSCRPFVFGWSSVRPLRSSRLPLVLVRDVHVRSSVRCHVFEV